MSQGKILTIDDDPDILDVLELTLSELYDVVQAPNGKEGLELAQTENPDLIITDYMMPVMTGPEFCKEIKKDMLLMNIPVIMLTGKGEVKDKIDGLAAGADDYLVKPFEPDELLARIKGIMRRTESSLDANPLTHLPGNTSIMEEIQRRISEKQMFAVGYSDLDKFKVYNDKYGFEKGDEVIKFTSRILVKAVRKKGEAKAFVGHIGGDDFVYICEDVHADDVAKAIIEEFDALSPSLYNDEDKNAGYIVGKDRQGNEIKCGLLSISIGIVSNKQQPINHPAQVGEIGAELKKYAKGFDNSVFVRDQRKSENDGDEEATEET